MKKLLSVMFALLAAVLLPLSAEAAVVDVAFSKATQAFTQSDIVALQRAPFTNPNLFQRGANIGVMLNTVTCGATDSNGSDYRVFGNVDPNAIPVCILVGNTANTSGTSYSLGFYAPGVGGAALAANALFNAQTMATARTSLGPGTALDGMSAVLPVNVGQPMWKLAGDSNNTTRSGYDITLTANTAGTAGGTVTVLLFYVLPQINEN